MLTRRRSDSRSGAVGRVQFVLKGPGHLRDVLSGDFEVEKQAIYARPVAERLTVGLFAVGKTDSPLGDIKYVVVPVKGYERTSDVVPQRILVCRLRKCDLVRSVRAGRQAQRATSGQTRTLGNEGTDGTTEANG